MFGFSEIGTSGGVIERLIENARERTATVGLMEDFDVLRQLFDRTERLAHEVESAGAGHTGDP
jgi:hypothetical protein